MKIRNGFVSNSSSSSFVISLHDLTAWQLEGLKKYKSKHDNWVFNVTEHSIEASTIMDNGGMEKHLFNLRIKDEIIHWDRY